MNNYGCDWDVEVIRLPEDSEFAETTNYESVYVEIDETSGAITLERVGAPFGTRELPPNIYGATEWGTTEIIEAFTWDGFPRFDEAPSASIYGVDKDGTRCRLNISFHRELEPLESIIARLT